MTEKKSASYYTPEPIVQYIVKNTIDPLIEKIVKETENKFEQIEKILALNILDPAMGSGHFLIGVVNYVASRICEIEYGVILEDELIKCKRDVARRCIYGVDLNPLAVDLAMVSLWLETLSTDLPLSFLSAHLKNGNSLIGSQIEILYNKQTTLMESLKGREQFKRNVKDYLMLENMEDSSPSAVKSKLEKYQKMQEKGTIYSNLKFLLDCKTAEYFGLDIPVIGDFKAKIGDSLDFFSDEKWINVQNFSSKTKFFHWDLEFPDIFYDENGDKRNDGGFDIVLGNPPYGNSIPKEQRNILKNILTTLDGEEGSFNASSVFLESVKKLIHSDGYLSFIIPNSISRAKEFKKIRDFLITNYTLLEIDDEGSPFNDVTLEMITIFCKNFSKNTDYDILIKGRNKCAH